MTLHTQEMLCMSKELDFSINFEDFDVKIA